MLILVSYNQQVIGDFPTETSIDNLQVFLDMSNGDRPKPPVTSQ